MDRAPRRLLGVRYVRPMTEHASHRGTVVAFAGVAAVFALPLGACKDAPLQPVPAAPVPCDFNWTEEIESTVGSDPIDFTPCALLRASQGATDAECATVTVPLRRDVEKSGNITLFVKRLAASSGTATGQLWFIAGGPGHAGAGFETGWRTTYSELLPDHDLYLVDHRGTGESTRLTCEDLNESVAAGLDDPEAAPVQACGEALASEWGEDLVGFSAAEAARDIGELVSRTREPGQTVSILGGSYGTYVALQYARMFPAQADAIALRSICPPGLCAADYDAYTDDGIRSVLDACGQDETCQSKLGDDPVARAEALFEAIDGGHCPDAGVGRGELRRVLGVLGMSRESRAGIPAVIYRLERCDAGDAEAVASLADFVPWFVETSLGPHYSHGLAAQISIRELMPPAAKTPEEFAATAEAAIGSIDLGLRYSLGMKSWPSGERDACVDQWAPLDVPTLVLHAELDSQTPPAWADLANERYDRADQTVVSFPHADHQVLDSSITESGDTPCGQQILASFLGAPDAAPDTSCVADLTPFDWSDSSMARLGLGTDDLWENL
jgi:pimeloyl-ACP methyl ester carboxylesterase